MITVPVEDFVFVVCALLGGALLLVTVVFDDIIGGVLDALHIGVEIGGTSLAPLLIAFVAMFGVGGLFATQLLDVHGGQAALVGLVSGLGGVAIAYALFTVFRRSEGKSPFSLKDLVGRTASVAVGIPAGAYGSVYISAEGQTHEFTATATTAIPAGTPVTITAVAGNGLVVMPAIAQPAPPSLQGGGPRA